MNQLTSSFMYYFSRTNKHLKTKTLCQFFFYIEKLLSQHQHDILKKKKKHHFNSISNTLLLNFLGYLIDIIHT